MKKFVITLSILSLLLTASACSKNEGGEQQSSTETTATTATSTTSTTTASTASSSTVNYFLNPTSFSFNEVSAMRPDPNMPTITLPSQNFSIAIPNVYEASDLEDIGPISDAQIAEINENTKKLISKLETEFKNAGINVKVDSKTGEVSLDSSVLFGGDSAELSAGGKTFLNKFIKAYSSVITSSEFNGFIKHVYVEGHTAPVQGSTYESGMPLSKQRADNVKNYCVSDKTGIDSATRTKLSSTLKPVGLSNSKPVKDASGKIDMEASRRVTFRFVINIK